MLSQHAAQAFFKYLSITSCLQINCVRHEAVRSSTTKLHPPHICARQSSSSTRWKSRQGKDSFAREAKVQGLKSRAAFKLLEIDAKYKVFRKGQTIVDLGYAPGSWSQVAVERTKPNGRIVGIDIIPAQPPKGVSTIQGNFLSSEVQAEVKRFLRDANVGRPRGSILYHADGREEIAEPDEIEGKKEEEIGTRLRGNSGKRKEQPGRVVDVVLSDMSAPWDQTSGFWKRSLSDPYYRMMNTTGINFKDHAGSMDLCTAALLFAYDTLKVGGHFVCKFYQGAEDKEFENELRKVFAAVHREKPDSSRSESKEAYFVAMKRKPDVIKAESKVQLDQSSEPQEKVTDSKEGIGDSQ